MKNMSGLNGVCEPYQTWPSLNLLHFMVWNLGNAFTIFVENIRFDKLASEKKISLQTAASSVFGLSNCVIGLTISWPFQDQWILASVNAS